MKKFLQKIKALFAKRKSYQIKYLVSVHSQYWEDKFGSTTWNYKFTREQKFKLQEDLYQELDNKLSGRNKNFCSILCGGFTHPSHGNFIPYIKIEVLEPKLPEANATVNLRKLNAQAQANELGQHSRLQ
jgi:hypothetical protein